jgi:beta-N-acetylhexosaminidase
MLAIRPGYGYNRLAMGFRGQIWRLGLVILLAIALVPANGHLAVAQEGLGAASPFQAEVDELMAQMNDQERIGQLFIVTFVGDTAGAETSIADLIINYHIGGVVLWAENENITDALDPVTQIAGLVNELQTRASETSTGEETGTETPAPAEPGPFIPLLIGIEHEGDGYPFSQIQSGLTEIPSNMAIGATWQPDYAAGVGEIVGQELATLGINMLLGPSLDVLESPRPDSPGGLGTRSFGGDPYWVGEMGKAYIRGVHEGSQNRIAVIAKHFPGHGGSDRQPGQEVPTVRKSLEQLKQIELAPFFAVTGNAEVLTETVDALMTSHIRYQGFQGNIRQSTRPISFDPQALETIMALPEFASWREAQGVIMSDALGVRAVKRFYDPQLREFPHRQIAQDAFLAGNDLLYLSDFSASGAYSDHVANIKDTLAWFYERYGSDVAFQTRVDQAVRRVLLLKLKLYGGEFSLDNTLVPVSQVADSVGNAGDRIVLLAQDAVTLIAPGPEEVAERLSSPPEKSENIVIFTDTRTAQQCSRCSDRSLIGVNALQNTILRLYGPDGSNQVLPGRISSFSFEELETFLATPAQPSPEPTATPEGEQTPEPPPPVQAALDGADWILFAMLDVTSSQPQSDAVKTFLAERPDIANQAKIIVLAFNAPYYLDTTEISKLTAYYGVYSKIRPFIEASVKTIFQQLKPRGSSPVSIPSTGYDLIEITSPSANQIIQLSFDHPAEAEGGTPEPLDLRVGDVLKVKTGVIVDHNSNPVPDGTLVQFTVSYLSEGLGLDVPQPLVPTTDGVARIDILLNVPGQLQIKASSGDARASIGLAVTAFEDQPAIVEAFTPVPTETPTPIPPTPTATPTEAPPTVTSTPSPSPSPTTAPILVPRVPLTPRLELAHLATALLGVVVTAGGGFWLGINARRGEASWGLRLALVTLIGGLLGYNYYALDLPGTGAMTDLLGRWGAAGVSWAAALVTLAVTAVWMQRNH